MPQYRVRSGDTLYGIAQELGISASDLYAENRGLIGSNPNYIQAGWTLSYTPSGPSGPTAPPEQEQAFAQLAAGSPLPGAVEPPSLAIGPEAPAGFVPKELRAAVRQAASEYEYPYNRLEKRGFAQPTTPVSPKVMNPVMQRMAEGGMFRINEEIREQIPESFIPTGKPSLTIPSRIRTPSDVLEELDTGVKPSPAPIPVEIPWYQQALAGAITAIGAPDDLLRTLPGAQTWYPELVNIAERTQEFLDAANGAVWNLITLPAQIPFKVVPAVWDVVTSEPVGTQAEEGLLQWLGKGAAGYGIQIMEKLGRQPVEAAWYLGGIYADPRVETLLPNQDILNRFISETAQRLVGLTEELVGMEFLPQWQSELLAERRAHIGTFERFVTARGGEPIRDLMALHEGREEWVEAEPGDILWHRIFGRINSPFGPWEQMIFDTGISGMGWTFTPYPWESEEDMRLRELDFMRTVLSDLDKPFYEHVAENSHHWKEAIFSAPTDLTNFLPDEVFQVLFPPLVVAQRGLDWSLGRFWSMMETRAGILGPSKRSIARKFGQAMEELMNDMHIYFEHRPISPEELIPNDIQSGFFPELLRGQVPDDMVLAERVRNFLNGYVDDAGEVVEGVVNHLADANMQNIVNLLRKYGPTTRNLSAKQITEFMHNGRQAPLQVFAELQRAISHLRAEQLGVNLRPHGAFWRTLNDLASILVEHWLWPNLAYHGGNLGNDTFRIAAAGYVPNPFDFHAAAKLERYMATEYALSMPPTIGSTMVSDALDAGTTVVTARLPWPIGDNLNFYLQTLDAFMAPLGKRLPSNLMENMPEVATWIIRNLNWSTVLKGGAKFGILSETSRRATVCGQAIQEFVESPGGFRDRFTAQITTTPPEGLPPAVQELIVAGLESRTIKNFTDFDFFLEMAEREVVPASLISLDPPDTLPDTQISELLRTEIRELELEYVDNLNSPLFQRQLQLIFDRYDQRIRTAADQMIRTVREMVVDQLPEEFLAKYKAIDQTLAQAPAGIFKSSGGTTLVFGDTLRNMPLDQRPSAMWITGGRVFATDFTHDSGMDALKELLGPDHDFGSAWGYAIRGGDPPRATLAPNFDLGQEYIAGTYSLIEYRQDLARQAQILLDIGEGPDTLVLHDPVPGQPSVEATLESLATPFEADLLGPGGEDVVLSLSQQVRMDMLNLKERGLLSLDKEPGAYMFPGVRYMESQLLKVQAGTIADNVVIGSIFEGMDPEDAANLATYYLEGGPLGLAEAYQDALVQYNLQNIGGRALGEAAPVTGPTPIRSLTDDFTPEQLVAPVDFLPIKGVYTREAGWVFGEGLAHGEILDELGIESNKAIAFFTNNPAGGEGYPQGVTFEIKSGPREGPLGDFLNLGVDPSTMPLNVFDEVTGIAQRGRTLEDLAGRTPAAGAPPPEEEIGRQLVEFEEGQVQALTDRLIDAAARYEELLDYTDPDTGLYTWLPHPEDEPTFGADLSMVPGPILEGVVDSLTRLKAHGFNVGVDAEIREVPLLEKYGWQMTITPEDRIGPGGISGAPGGMWESAPELGKSAEFTDYRVEAPEPFQPSDMERVERALDEGVPLAEAFDRELEIWEGEEAIENFMADIKRAITDGGLESSYVFVYANKQLYYSRTSPGHGPLKYRADIVDTQPDVTHGAVDSRGRVVIVTHSYEDALDFSRYLIVEGLDERTVIQVRFLKGAGQPYDDQALDTLLGQFSREEFLEDVDTHVWEQAARDFRDTQEAHIVEMFQAQRTGQRDYRRTAQRAARVNAQSVRQNRAEREAAVAGVESVRQQFHDGMDAARQYGASEANRVLFDYQMKGDPEEMLRLYTAFSTWQLRNPAFFAQYFAKRPNVLGQFYRFWRAMEADRKRRNLTSRFEGVVGTETPGFAGAPPGYWGWQVTKIFGIFDQFQAPFEPPGEERPTGFAGVIRNIIDAGGWAGIRPWPFIEYPLQKLGVLPDEGVGEILGVPQRFLEALLRQLGVTEHRGQTAQFLFDYYTRRRLAELEAENPDVPHIEFVEALTHQAGEWWERAQRESIAIQNIAMILSSLVPGQIKFASIGELDIRKALLEVGGDTFDPGALSREDFPFLETYGLALGNDPVRMQTALIYATYDGLLQDLNPASPEYRALIQKRQDELDAIGATQQFTGTTLHEARMHPGLFGADLTQIDVLRALSQVEPNVGQFADAQGSIDWEAYNESIRGFNANVPVLSEQFGVPISEEEWFQYRDRYERAVDVAYDMHRDQVDAWWEEFESIQPGGANWGQALREYISFEITDAIKNGMHPDDAMRYASELFVEAQARGLPYEVEQRWMGEEATGATQASIYSAQVAARLGMTQAAAFYDLRDYEFPGMYGTPDARDVLQDYYYDLTPPEQREFKEFFNVPEEAGFSDWLDNLDDEEAAELARQAKRRAHPLDPVVTPWAIVATEPADWLLPPWDQLSPEEEDELKQVKRDWFQYNLRNAAETIRPGPWTPLMEKYFGDEDSAQSQFWELIGQYKLTDIFWGDPVMEAAMDRISRRTLDFNNEQWFSVIDHFNQNLELFVDQEGTDEMWQHPDWLEAADRQQEDINGWKIGDLETLRAAYMNVPWDQRKEWEVQNPDVWPELKAYMAMRTAVELGNPYYLWQFRNWDYRKYYGAMPPDEADVRADQLRDRYEQVIRDWELWQSGQGPWTQLMIRFIGPDPAGLVFDTSRPPSPAQADEEEEEDGGTQPPPPPPPGPGGAAPAGGNGGVLTAARGAQMLSVARVAFGEDVVAEGLRQVQENQGAVTNELLGRVVDAGIASGMAEDSSVEIFLRAIGARTSFEGAQTMPAAAFRGGQVNRFLPPNIRVPVETTRRGGEPGAPFSETSILHASLGYGNYTQAFHDLVEQYGVFPAPGGGWASPTGGTFVNPGSPTQDEYTRSIIRHELGHQAAVEAGVDIEEFNEVLKEVIIPVVPGAELVDPMIARIWEFYTGTRDKYYEGNELAAANETYAQIFVFAGGELDAVPEELRSYYERWMK